MRLLLLLSLFITVNGFGQYTSFIIGQKGDTLNIIDSKGLKQGKWVIRVNSLRGEPGYEEEGMYVKDKREGPWRRYTLMGDLVAMENYKWGNKDGKSMYFNGLGELLREENWKALNPEKLYDTLDIEDVDKPDHYKKVIVKNEGAGIRHGHWTYYDPVTKFITKEENYFLGTLEGKKKDPAMASSSATEKKVAKPKEVLEFEKQNAGKKKIKVRDGSTGY
jgi:antitoxin component YwqK of YwqJK toxin-antitoxin module